MIYFVGAGSGEAKLVTIKAKELLEKAEVVLYTGSLIPKEVLSWVNKNALVLNSHNLKYEEIFELFLKYKEKIFVRLHTGDPSIYSTIAKQIEFLKINNIEFEIVPGVTAAFAAAATLGIEYTIPGVSQSLIISRIEGNTPQPQSLKSLLSLKNSSFVFYLSIKLISKLIKTALELGYDKNTPVFVVYKASWPDEKIYKGNLSNIEKKVSHLKGIAVILFGEFLNQKEKHSSHLYNLGL